MKLTDWTLDFFHKNPAYFWLEGRRNEWALPLQVQIAQLMSGRAFVMSCDGERDWFVRYFLQRINRRNAARPMLPFFALDALAPGANETTTRDEFCLIEDLLWLAFPQGFTHFYVGRAGGRLSQLIRGKENSYLWLFDEQDANSFLLSSKDSLLDAKLLQLFDLLSKSIDEVLWGRVEV